MTVTAQLMMGHEMALPLIMIERMLERRTEREAIEVILTGCSEEAGGVKEEEEEEEEIRADTVKSIHDSLFLTAAQSSPLCPGIALSLSFSALLLLSFLTLICSVRSLSSLLSTILPVYPLSSIQLISLLSFSPPNISSLPPIPPSLAPSFLPAPCNCLFLCAVFLQFLASSKLSFF